MEANERTPLHAFTLHCMTLDARKPSSCGHKCKNHYLMWNTEGVTDKAVVSPTALIDPLEDFMDAPVWEGAPRRRDSA